VPKPATKYPKRDQTADEVAEILDQNERTIRRWASEGCPHTVSQAQGKPLMFNDGEVQAWATANNKTGKPGRPKSSAVPVGLENDKDYWLARKYKNQCLRDEGVLVDRAEIISELSQLVQTAKNQLLGGPSQLAPRCYGQDVPTIERILSEWLEPTINRISLSGK